MMVYAPPEVMTRERYVELQRQRRQRDANSAYLNRLAGFGSSPYVSAASVSTTNERNARCESAKARRASMRKVLGMKISYLQTRQLDEMVYDACK